MIHSPKFTVVLDACVLYPAPVRDILLSLADVGLFKPKWTDQIQDEWIKNLLKNSLIISGFSKEEPTSKRLALRDSTSIISHSPACAPENIGHYRS